MNPERSRKGMQSKFMMLTLLLSTITVWIQIRSRTGSEALKLAVQLEPSKDFRGFSCSLKQNAYRQKDKWALFSPIEKLVILALSTELLVMLRQRFKMTLLRYSRIGNIDFGDGL